MAAFALSCFGILLFLWLHVRRPGAAEAEGLPGARASSPRPPRWRRRPTSASPASRWARSSSRRRPTEGAATDVTLEIDHEYAPIPKDTKAILRQKTLLGETYVELTPGRRSRGTIADGGRSRAAQVSPTVELDEIFRALRREDARGVPAPGSTSRAARSTNRGQDINDALGNLAPFAEDTTTRPARSSTRRRATCGAWCATPARSSARSPSARASCAT